MIMLLDVIGAIYMLIAIAIFIYLNSDCSDFKLYEILKQCGYKSTKAMICIKIIGFTAIALLWPLGLAALYFENKENE